jgi:hypothetical protein
MTSTGRHLDETQAGIPNAPSERADLYGQSYCERHQGQLPKGRTQRPDIWAHRSRMRSAKEKRALDRGVVPHMGIPLSYTWLNPSTRPSDATEVNRVIFDCGDHNRTVDDACWLALSAASAGAKMTSRSRPTRSAGSPSGGLLSGSSTIRILEKPRVVLSITFHAARPI